MRRALKCSFMILLLCALGGAVCAAKKAPKMPPDPKFLAIANTSVLPIVDARAGTKAGVNLAGLQRNVVKLLDRQHYPASAGGSGGSAGQIAEEDLQGATAAFVKKLGPADARWVMVVCLDDVASKITFGSTGNAEVSGFLFDKESGELLWSGKGVGQAGQGGLIGMGMKGMMKGEALDAALANLIARLPKRPKPRK